MAHESGEVIELRLPTENCPRTIRAGHDLRRIAGAPAAELNREIELRDALDRIDQAAPASRSMISVISFDQP